MTDLNQLTFGLREPKRVAKSKVEKYDFPVITLLPVDGEGKNHKISFNDACYKDMNLSSSSMIVFGKTTYGRFFVDGKDLPAEHDAIKRKMTKINRDIASKDDYTSLLSHFKHLEVKGHPMELKVEIEASEELGMTIGKLMFMPENNDGCIGGDCKEVEDAEIIEEEVILKDQLAVEVAQ